MNAHKNCAICGESFDPKENSRRKYCSAECQLRSRRTESTCIRCSSSFQSTRKGQKLCASCREKRCLAPGCDVMAKDVKTRFKKGFCNPHYQRFAKYGDPLAGNKSPTILVAIDHEDGTRTCSRCGLRKQLEDYYKDKLGTKGRRSYCKECQKSSISARYKNDPEKKREYQRQHRIENLSEVRQKDLERYERDKEKRISLAEAQGHIRRARKNQAPFERGITRTALRKIHGENCFYCGVEMQFARARNREFNSNDATIEHRLPLSRGGKHVWDNVVLACRECNLSKNMKTEVEFTEYKTKIDDAGKK